MMLKNHRPACHDAIASIFPELAEQQVEMLAERLFTAYSMGRIQHWEVVNAKSPEGEASDLRKAASYLRKAAACVRGDKDGPRGGGFGAGDELRMFAYDLLAAWGDAPTLAAHLPEGSQLMARHSLLDKLETIATVAGTLEWQANALDAAGIAIGKNSDGVRERIKSTGNIVNGNKGKNILAHRVATECCVIVAAVTGEPATLGRNPVTGETTGQLYKLVRAAYCALEIDASPADMAKAAQKRMKFAPVS
ncbi:hypothetical protein [Primorskyibacter flagellatus]|uniref:Uncharacterized protein n=1 Tax=Primorskyibacter flagellatus TaxID=1387277 RepID=A0A1W2B459_9RHOB|nr:hypothetical protein [Primorskyibacter flagellatus]SMC67580.1 hypothetical protein SAMN06295998_103481 [Primorskyibacter flagellatus]